MKQRQYLTYRFINKDPIIDLLRTIVQDEAKSRNVSFRTMLGIIEVESHVSVSCMLGWFKGGTKKPQMATIMAVVIACGPRARRAMAGYILSAGEDGNVIPFRQKQNMSKLLKAVG